MGFTPATPSTLGPPHAGLGAQFDGDVEQAIGTCLEGIVLRRQEGLRRAEGQRDDQGWRRAGRRGHGVARAWSGLAFSGLSFYVMALDKTILLLVTNFHSEMKGLRFLPLIVLDLSGV